jgi:phage terminase large subunit GpA
MPALSTKPWELQGDSVAAGSLAARLERYPAEVPTGVGVLVAAVDVQGDRLEAVVKGYGADEESWLIAFTQLHGDPAREPVWHELDRFLAQEFEHESGRKLRIQRTVIDSGGAHTEHVYRYCKARNAAGRGVYPVKGGTIAGRPLLERPSIHNRYRVPLFVLCVDTGKEIVFSRLLISSLGQGYLHLPDWVDSEYLAQLTAEKAIRKYVKGRGSSSASATRRSTSRSMRSRPCTSSGLPSCVRSESVRRRSPDRPRRWRRRRWSLSPRRSSFQGDHGAARGFGLGCRLDIDGRRTSATLMPPSSRPRRRRPAPKHAVREVPRPSEPPGSAAIVLCGNALPARLEQIDMRPAQADSPRVARPMSRAHEEVQPSHRPRARNRQAVPAPASPQPHGPATRAPRFG